MIKRTKKYSKAVTIAPEASFSLKDRKKTQSTGDFPNSKYMPSDTQKVVFSGVNNYIGYQCSDLEDASCIKTSNAFSWENFEAENEDLVVEESYEITECDFENLNQTEELEDAIPTKEGFVNYDMVNFDEEDTPQLPQKDYMDQEELEQLGDPKIDQNFICEIQPQNPSYYAQNHPIATQNSSEVKEEKIEPPMSIEKVKKMIEECNNDDFSYGISGQVLTDDLLKYPKPAVTLPQYKIPDLHLSEKKKKAKAKRLAKIAAEKLKQEKLEAKQKKLREIAIKFSKKKKLKKAKKVKKAKKTKNSSRENKILLT